MKQVYGWRFCVLCQTFGGNPRSHDMKQCQRHKVITETRKRKSDEHMSVEELYATSKKLSRKEKKLKKKHRQTYESESSSDSDSDWLLVKHGGKLNKSKSNKKIKLNDYLPVVIAYLTNHVDRTIKKKKKY